MITKENVVIKYVGKRAYLLRNDSENRENTLIPKANFMGTGLALVGVTKKCESVDAYIERINSMKNRIQKETNAAFALHRKERRENKMKK